MRDQASTARSVFESPECLEMMTFLHSQSADQVEGNLVKGGYTIRFSGGSAPKRWSSGCERRATR